MKPRVGHIQFLNSLPLYHCLVQNQVVLNIDLFKDSPKALCHRLLADEPDISTEFLKDYFTGLKFEFGPEYQQGFLTYLRKARQLGAIDDVPELFFHKCIGQGGPNEKNDSTDHGPLLFSGETQW